MKTKKVFTSLFLTVAITAMLTGCNDNQNETNFEVGKNSIMTLNAVDLIDDMEFNGIVDFSSVSGTDEDVVKQINSYLEYYPVYKHVTNGTVGETSIINIDFVGMIGDVQFSGGTAKDQMLNIANSTYIKGFAEQCIGHSVGETFDINVTFPADYEGTYLDSDGSEKNFANSNATFKITINYIAGEQIISYEMMDDQAVIDLTGGQNKTVQEFFNETKNEIIDSQVSSLEVQMWDKLVSNIKYKSGKDATIQKYIDEALDYEVAYYKKMAEYYEQDYITFISKTLNFESEEKFNEFLKNDVKYTIEQNIIVDYVAEKNDLIISDEEYKKLALEMATEYGYETIEAFETDYEKVEIYEFLQYTKVTDYLMELNGYKK